VPVKRLNEQVKRNAGRFPPDFAFQLAREEFANLKSQFATSSLQWGGRRKLPTAFTEHGALMAASVLNSPRAVQMSILVVRAFVRFRRILATNRQLAAKVDELERTMDQKFAATTRASSPSQRHRFPVLRDREPDTDRDRPSDRIQRQGRGQGHAQTQDRAARPAISYLSVLRGPQFTYLWAP